MKVGYLQFEPKFGDIQANIDHIKEFLKDKIFNLIVLPELSNSGYLFNSINELEEYSEIIPDGQFCQALK